RGRLTIELVLRHRVCRREADDQAVVAVVVGDLDVVHRARSPGGASGLVSTGEGSEAIGGCRQGTGEGHGARAQGEGTERRSRAEAPAGSGGPSAASRGRPPGARSGR